MKDDETCAAVSRRYWQFGDVIRVDPANERVPQPDDRRWLILTPARSGRPWLTLFLGGAGPGSRVGLVPFGSMTGFIRVEEAS